MSNIKKINMSLKVCLNSITLGEHLMPSGRVFDSVAVAVP